MSSTHRNAAAGDGLADSIYTFTFTAASGDAWGGWMVADSTAFSAGFTLVTAFGHYLLTSEQETGTDLAAEGLAEGMVFVEWYRDSLSGGFLVTRNGPGVASGLAGLGSEADAAWNGAAWDGFGGGGADQADAARLPADTRFAWTFTARSGDRWEGVLFDLAPAFAPGDAVQTAHGTYRITAETPLTAGEAAPERGTVRLAGEYHDAGSSRRFAVQGPGTDAGTAGLGSETGAAWNGEGWVPFGGGGAFQVELDRDSSYYFTYWNPISGDSYGGWLIEDSGRYAAGQVIPAHGGEYRIWTETAFGGHSGFDNGTIWISYYHDAPTNRWLTPQSWSNGAPVATRGLGLETDLVWDGDNWDWFGQGQTWWVELELDSVYHWVFIPWGGGDDYRGRLTEASSRFAPGNEVWTDQGRYVITAEQELGRAAETARGTIWIDAYWDAGSGRALSAYFPSVGQSSGTAGLGSESDWIWDGDNHDWAGFGDTRWVDVELDSLYWWVFVPWAGGDDYRGRLIDASSRFAPGSEVWTGWGRYLITGEREFGGAGDAPRGTVWIDAYWDAGAGRGLASYFPSVGRASGTAGLGSESDWIWDGDNHDWAGFGDTRWVNVE
jgi:hypothetical protein